MKTSSEKIKKRNQEIAKKRLIDMSGKKYNFLLGIERVILPRRETMWKFLCDCGNETIANGSHVRKGKIMSCGCYVLKVNSERMKNNLFGLKHGLTTHPLRAIRKSMIDRCYNPKNKFYKNYGKRGVMVCDSWLNSLEEFHEWALSNGWVKGLSIDRIDNNGNYTPQNCHWITISENSSKSMKRLWETEEWKKKKK